MSSRISLQLTLSPGDVKYAALTVPRLIHAHKDSVDETLLVVDCVKPARTKLFDPATRCAEPAFSQRASAILGYAEGLLEDGTVDRVIALTTGKEPVCLEARRNYVGRLVKRTHDYGGCGLLSYFVGLQAAAHRFVVHYDADIVLYQKDSFDWPALAIDMMSDPHIVFATPRISPPFAGEKGQDGPSLTEGRPFHAVEGGWKNDWFSTRCFLADVERLRRYTPLIRGRLLAETAAVKLLRRGYPRSPEVMLYRTVGGAGGWRLNLSSRDAWYIHPSDKGTEFLELLPRILESVANDRVPAEQRGYPEVNIAAWKSFFAHERESRLVEG